MDRNKNKIKNFGRKRTEKKSKRKKIKNWQTHKGEMP